MSSPAIRHILVCVLIFSGLSAVAENQSDSCEPSGVTDPEAKKCLRAFCVAKNACARARATADTQAGQLANQATAATANQTRVNRNADRNRTTNSGASAAYSTGRDACERVKPDCKNESKCNIAAIRDQRASTRVKREQTSCETTIQDHITALTSAQNETSRIASGSGNTGEASDGGKESNPAGQQQGQPPGQQPQQEQSQQQSPQSPPPSPQSSQAQTPAQQEAPKPADDVCQGANANLYAQCKSVVADKCKGQSPGAVGFGTPDPECANAASAKPAALSATCARFKQQCAGDTAGCLKTMSSVDRAKIQSECLGRGAEEPAQGTAGFGTQSLDSAVASTGGGGGGGGGASVGTSSGAKLDDLSDLKLPFESFGEREGIATDSLRVDSSGGYSQSVSDNNSSDSPSSSNSGSVAPMDVDRSIASQADGLPSVGNATDVTNRFGPSVFSIQSDVIKNRCLRGRLLHCRPQAK